MTHALLLTDVVDSTKLSEALGDAAIAALWARHDRVARDLLPVHNGREIDKTDGFLLLFEAASDAVAYAIAYHQALSSLEPPLTARAGLHVGEVILTENAPDVVARGAKPLEVDGVAKPTAARVMSVAAGGQTLLTDAARQSLGRTALRLESHGHWRMKGLAEPFELFEIGGPDAPFAPPPDGAKVYRVVEQGDLWLPVKQVKHSLPAERDAFVGRQSDLLTLARRLDTDARLVSVLGIGGTGKTRLVTRYGWTWLGDYPGGVWFCDLSEARSVDGIVYAVARALDVPLGKDDPVVQLGHAIAGRGRCLVVLDNFEQVARHAEETVGRWLDRAGEAQFVVTTREVLGLSGETALALAPLGQEEAADLFVARAVQARRDFALTVTDRPHVDALVRLLDGLPLAIELAAARVRLMPPKTLLQRMSERFKLLASSGGRHTRQATLRGALDWSWDLLSADEQSALAQLSVFEGGFTLEAAEGVLALDELWPMDAVQALVDKSLVRKVSDERFDLLVSVQEYAAERLSPAEQEEAEHRHGVFFAEMGEEGGELAGGVELDNLVVSIRRAAARGAEDVVVGALEGAWGALNLKGPFSVGVALAESVGAMAGLSPERTARVDAVAGKALRSVGRMDEARLRIEAALATFQRTGDRRREGIALGELGLLHLERGRLDAALSHHEAALAIAREARNRRGEGIALRELGILHHDQGRLDAALSHCEEALAIAREVENRRGEGQVLNSLGILYQHQGRLDAALSHYEGAVAIAREVGNRSGEGHVLTNLGFLHSNQGRMDAALSHYEAALAIYRDVGDRPGEGNLLGNLGLLHMNEGRMDAAHSRYEAALAIAREEENRRGEGMVLGNLGLLHQQQGRVRAALSHYEAALAATREVGNRRGEGIVLGNVGSLHRVTGDPEAARRALSEALDIHRDIDFAQGQPVWLLGLALLDAQADQHQTALDRAVEAVQLGAPYPEIQAEALTALARVHLAARNIEAAREAIDQAAALNQSKIAALVAATRALVTLAQGHPAEAVAALEEATADPSLCLPHTEVGQLVVQVRTLLAGEER